ncbi:glycoside hydrolase family 18 protein [uncultured Proteiniphilum sp.]|uniref:glycoside hydrolase family 18 protein n=1 Tax=uncultured Proteiniphilum sp. TaxID=497637 RepID=UPI00262C17D5|nr:glycoside hydrolase family 18 protein [uncultured Proteiniphilum sp.]
MEKSLRFGGKEKSSVMRVLAGYLLDKTGLTITKNDARKLTHLMIAFGKIDGVLIRTEHLAGLEKIALLKKWNPSLHILLSLVGAKPDSFSRVSAEEETRRRFAVSCWETVRRFDIDGVDLDWEYPCCPENFIEASPRDKENFTLLCEAIRKEFERRGEWKLLLTIAAGAGQYYVENTQMEKVSRYLDFVFLMTYDFRCGFHTLTGHHTNLYTSTGDLYRTSADAAVRLFLGSGVPASKIAIGGAMYSRMWTGVPDRNHGFLQPTEGSGKYGPVYSDLKADYINRNGYERFWDDEAKAPYLFNGNTFISYDDPQSLQCKCKYIKQHNLAGIFYWEHGGDRTGELLNAMTSILK